MSRAIFKNLACGNWPSAAPSVSAPSWACVFMISNSCVVQQPGLEQHVIGNADFADIVQRAGGVNQPNELAVDLVRETSDAAANCWASNRQ